MGGGGGELETGEGRGGIEGVWWDVRGYHCVCYPQ